MIGIKLNMKDSVSGKAEIMIKETKGGYYG